MWHLTACKFSASLSFLNLIKTEMIFLSHLWINVGNCYIKYADGKKQNISFRERETNWKFTGCQVPHFTSMIVLIPCINLSNLCWIIKCLFLRNMESFIGIICIVYTLYFSRALELFVWNMNYNALLDASGAKKYRSTLHEPHYFFTSFSLGIIDGENYADNGIRHFHETKPLRK